MRADLVLGIATVLMALVGGIVTLHAPAKWPAKIIYAVIFAVLGVVSVIYVRKQSNENVIANQNLSNALSNLGQSTANIANMTALNTQLQDKLLKQSDTITDLSRQSIAAVTGGDTYCYVLVSQIGNEFLLNIATKGSSPLHEVGVDMVDVDALRAFTATKQTFTWEIIQSFTTHYPTVPFLASSSVHPLSKIPTGPSDKRNLHFNFFSMNGVWGESINLRLVKGLWIQAINVTKEIKGNQRKTLYTYVPEEYPKVDGKMDW
jgi:hypothetical protein